MIREFLLIGLILGTSSLLAQSSKIIDPSDGVVADQPGDHHGESSALWLGLRISSQVDDNALSDNLNRRADEMTVLEPHLKWSVSRPHMEWSVDYGNGFSYSQPLAIYSSQSHSLDSSFRLRPIRRLKIVLTNTFQETRDPFASFSTVGLVATVAGNRTSTSFFPGADRTLEQAGGDLVYSLSRRSSVGAGGFFFGLKYHFNGTAEPVPQLLDEGNSAGGRVFYSYHLSPHQWSGVEYDEQTFNFVTNSTLNSLFFAHKLALTGSHALSVYVGAQQASTHGLADAGQAAAEPGRQMAVWNWAAGAASTWASAAGRLQIGLSRRTGNSMALPGAALITSATADFVHALRRSWTVDAAAAYNHEGDLGIASTKASLVYAGGGLARSFTPKMSLAVRYWRVHESTNSVAFRNFVADHNRFSVSVAYDFKVGH